MGCIYKIVNDINDKVYIGKTERDIPIRWKEHKKDAYLKDNKLYRAMRKYGIEHFSIQKICECDDTNIKEQYYIKQYDSYYNGYNSTFGGEGTLFVDTKEIIKLYNQNKTIKEISKETGHTTKTISNCLKSNNITIEDRRGRHRYDKQYIGKLYKDGLNCNEIAEQFSCSGRTIGEVLTELKIAHGPDNRKKVAQIDKQGKIINVFSSQVDAANFIRDNKISTANKATIGGHIGQICKGKGKTAYGYKWKYV